MARGKWEPTRGHIVKTNRVNQARMEARAFEEEGTKDTEVSEQQK